MCPRLPWDFRWWTKYECLGLRADLDDTQPAWPLTKVTIAPISGGSFAEEGFSHPYRRGSCRTVVAALVDFTRYDWYTESYVAFLTIACFMVTLVRILR